MLPTLTPSSTEPLPASIVRDWFPSIFIVLPLARPPITIFWFSVVIATLLSRLILLAFNLTDALSVPAIAPFRFIVPASMASGSLNCLLREPTATVPLVSVEKVTELKPSWNLPISATVRSKAFGKVPTPVSSTRRLTKCPAVAGCKSKLPLPLTVPL